MIPNYSFQLRKFAGPGYICMKEAGLAAAAAAGYLEGEGRDMVEDLIDTFWENPLAFALLVHHGGS